jgi:hypothetical protein
VLQNQEEARVSWSSGWRPVALVAVAGDGGAIWQGGEKPAGVRRAAGGRAGEPGGVGRVAWGNWQPRRLPTRGRRAAQQSNREEGERGRRRGLVLNYSKV